MLQPATLQLLRFHFSFFLLPVYLFAVGQVPHIDIPDTLLIFVILHFLVYPSSNGYNSFMDRDEGSIGGIENPLPPTRQLFYVSVGMDIIALLMSYWISIYFFMGILAYILASRAYSYRGIRLKKYPWLGYFTVVFFQGAVTFFIVYHGCSSDKTLAVPIIPLVSASLLMGSFYPLTQIYQHAADLKDGVKTISYLLGIKGTFIFTAIVYCLAMGSLAYYFRQTGHLRNFILLATLLLPVLVYFMRWAFIVWKDPSKADFKNTMRMNVLASCCSNAAFLTLLIISYFE